MMKNVRDDAALRDLSTPHVFGVVKMRGVRLRIQKCGRRAGSTPKDRLSTASLMRSTSRGDDRVPSGTSPESADVPFDQAARHDQFFAPPNFVLRHLKNGVQRTLLRRSIKLTYWTTSGFPTLSGAGVSRSLLATQEYHIITSPVHRRFLGIPG